MKVAFKYLLTALVVAIVLSPSLFVVYEWSLNLVLAVDESSLDFAPVELAELRPGERRAIECEIHNRSIRTLRLMVPKVSCGCLSQTNAPPVIKPGESTRL